MKKELQDVLLTKKSGVYIENLKDSEDNISHIELGYLSYKLSTLGYMISPEVANKLLTKDKSEVIDLLTTLYVSIESLIGNKDYKPMYINFHNKVPQMSETELYVNAVLHYLTGGEYMPENEEYSKEDYDFSSELVDVTIISEITKEEIKKLVVDMLNSSVVLADYDKTNLLILLDMFTLKEIESINELADIKIKEILIVFADYLSKKDFYIKNLFKTSTDLLRYIALVSDSKFDNKHIEYKRFNRTELRWLLTILENLDFILDDMKRYKKPWKRFFTLFQNKINWNKFPKVYRAKNVLFGKEKHTTMSNKLNTLYKNILNLDNSDLSSKEKFTKITELLDLWKKRNGEFSRHLVAILSNVDVKFHKLIINHLFSTIEDTNSRLLYQLKDRLINLGNIDRMIFVNNQFSKLNESRNVLSTETINYILEKINYTLEYRATLKPYLGGVYIDDSYKKINLSTSEKGTDESIRPMTKGSRIPFNTDTEVLRFFTGWKNNPERTDIDLSCGVLNENFDMIDFVTYYKLRNDYIFHSGDITNAPYGAMEYIDVLDFNRLPEDYRYLTISVNVFSGKSFKNIDTVFSGVLELTRKEARQRATDFYKAAVTQGFKHTSDTRNMITILVDVKEKEYIWIDSSDHLLADLEQTNLHTRKKDVEILAKYFVNKKYISLYDVISLNANCRGYLVSNKEEADIVFDKVDSSNPLALNDILANYI